MKKKKIFTALFLTSLILLSGCSFSNNYEELIEDNEVQEETSSLNAVDDSLHIKDNEVFNYESLDESMFSMEKENNVLKLENLSDFYLKDVSGKIIFLGENDDILNISPIYISYIAPNDLAYYTPYIEDIPETYNKYILDLEGIKIGKDLMNYKDNIIISSNENNNGIFAKISNNSDVDIKTINLKILFYKNNELVQSESYIFEQKLKSKDSTYEHIFYNYISEESFYDKYEIIIDLALDKSFTEEEYYIEK